MQQGFKYLKTIVPAPSFTLPVAALRCDNTMTVTLLFIVSLDTRNKHHVPPPCDIGKDDGGGESGVWGASTPFSLSNLSIAWLYADRWFEFELHAARTLISDCALNLSPILMDNGVGQAAQTPFIYYHIYLTRF